jgi:phospholipid/cholesterol/gamma-HCH transport system substrate-binding protein
MRQSKINYVIVGVFVVGMVAALLVSIAALTGRTGDTERYYAVYSNVSGVLPGTKVLFEGYQVGQVESIEPHRVGNETRFRVWMAVREGWAIPVDSVARIAASGLLSAVAVDIKAGTADVYVKPGDEISAGRGGNLFAVMSEVAGEVADLSNSSLKPLLNNLNRQVDMLGTILRDSAPELMANLIGITGDLAGKTPVITDNIRDFSAELNETGDRLNRALQDKNLAAIDDILVNASQTTVNFGQLTADLRQTQAQLDAVLLNLDNVVTRNQGSVQAALNDLRHTMATLSRSVGTISGELEGAARNVNEFTRDVRRNPTTLLRGSPNEERPGTRR